MNNFETMIEFLNEERPCLIGWVWAEDQVVIKSAEVALIQQNTYTGKGDFKPWDDFRTLNIIVILSDDQISDLAHQVKGAQARIAAEDYDDSAMQDWEERNRRILTA